MLERPTQVQKAREYELKITWNENELFVWLSGTQGQSRLGATRKVESIQFASVRIEHSLDQALEEPMSPLFAATLEAGTTGYFVGWGTLSLINAGLAQSKQSSGLFWWFVSLFLGPIATFLIVVFVHPKPLSER
jgi:hypothetical protein